MATNPSQLNDSAIAEVLTRNIEVAEQIRASASELEVVHAVLSSKVTPKGNEGDIPAAVERTREIEQQLRETAKALDSSNEKLGSVDSNKTVSNTAKQKDIDHSS